MPRETVPEDFPQFETFEYGVHRLLARFALADRAKTSIARGVIALAREHLELEAIGPPKTRAFAGGSTVHYCPGIGDETYCGRVLRSRLQVWRKAPTPEGVTCQYCRQGIKRDKLT